MSLKMRVGRCFHIIEDGEINKQGIVTGTVNEYGVEYVTVDLCEWFTGMYSETKRYPRSEALKWTFYLTAEDMRAAYEAQEANKEKSSDEEI